MRKYFGPFLIGILFAERCLIVHHKWILILWSEAFPWMWGVDSKYISDIECWELSHSLLCIQMKKDYLPIFAGIILRGEWFGTLNI